VRMVRKSSEDGVEGLRVRTWEGARNELFSRRSLESPYPRSVSPGDTLCLANALIARVELNGSDIYSLIDTKRSKRCYTKPRRTTKRVRISLSATGIKNREILTFHLQVVYE